MALCSMPSWRRSPILPVGIDKNGGLRLVKTLVKGVNCAPEALSRLDKALRVSGWRRSQAGDREAVRKESIPRPSELPLRSSRSSIWSS